MESISAYKIRLYGSVWAVTQLILTCLFSIAIHQFCQTDYFNEKARIRRTILVIFNIGGFCILNALNYLLVFYQGTILFLNITIFDLYIFIEGVCIILAFHTNRVIIMFMINAVYTSTGIRIGKWFTYTIYVMEALVMLTTFGIYTFVLVRNDRKVLYSFYMGLEILMVIQAICAMVMVHRPLRILNQVSIIPDVNEQEVRSAKRYLHGAAITALFVALIGATDVAFNYFNIKAPTDYLSKSATLNNTVLHSVVIIAISFVLVMIIHKRWHCCIIPNESVCAVWICQMVCCSWMNERVKVWNDGNEHNVVIVVSPDKNKALLHTESSTTTSINTNVTSLAPNTLPTVITE